MKHSTSPLLRLLAINAALGGALAVVMLGGLLLLDIAGLRSLIARDHTPLVPLLLLGLGLAVTFACGAIATAMMALGGDEARNKPHGGELIPLRVVSRRHSKRH